MSGEVKGSNPARRDQARTRLARRAVVDAARTLFLKRGYAATSIEAIGELAAVPQATVYRLFRSKLGILKALLDASIAGDDRPIPVQERPEVAPLRNQATDPIAVLEGLAAVATSINRRTHDIYRVLTSAAASDPAAAALLDEVQQQRLRGQSELARSLHRRRALRPGLSASDAVDLVHAIASPELYRLLVVERGWSPGKFQRWLAATLVQQLTGPAPT